MDIILEHVGKSFNGQKVLDNLSLTFTEGAISCLTGPSGCGKTTLLNIVAGITRQDSGNVRGTEGKKMAYAFQTPHLIPWKTVIGNVEFVLPDKMPADERRARATACLELVELSQDADRLPEELSRGMAQRASLARALATDAGIILLDEPFSALDKPLKERLAARLKQHWAGCHPTVILVTHSEEDASSLSASVLNMGE